MGENKSMHKIKVNTKFDGGSIEVVDISNPHQLQFKIRKDTNSHFCQWFYFQLNNVADQALQVKISDLKNTAYPEAWKDYRICMSYDNQSWFRLDTRFDGDNLEFNLRPKFNTLYFAYFEPYSYNRHLQLLGYANQSPLALHRILGETAEGRNLDLIMIGNLSNPKYKIWITARQHPGETMAEWFMEGLIHRLLDMEDATSKSLLKQAVFYLVPNMNPDGAYHGNLRVNTTGTNLNREWVSPSLDRSPEVAYVRNEMVEIGVDMFFDIHGDEAISYVFTSGCYENPSFSLKQEKLSHLFEKYLAAASLDYQTKIGYIKDHFKTETATLASYWVGNRFDCLAFTLEMPFKDNANLPDIVHGWSGQRSYLLGQSFLTAISLVMDDYV